MSKKRCQWAENSFPAYEKYHDQEWGVPVHDDRQHFEFLILEAAQAGLSWSTVLKKRLGYRRAFADFDPVIVADFPESMIEELMLDPGIIRNRLKIKSAINNAKRFIEVQQEFGTFDNYIWSFTKQTTIHGHWKSVKEVPAVSNISDELSKDLKKRGFNFVGSTIMYAHLQAVGILNDHTIDCFRFQELVNT